MKMQFSGEILHIAVFIDFQSDDASEEDYQTP